MRFLSLEEVSLTERKIGRQKGRQGVSATNQFSLPIGHRLKTHVQSDKNKKRREMRMRTWLTDVDKGDTKVLKRSNRRRVSGLINIHDARPI